MSKVDGRDDRVVATGPNVGIRLRVRDDAADEYRWRSDPETARFDGREPYREPFERFLDVFGYELAYGRTDREQFAIDTVDGEHLGTVMLYNFGHGRETAEFGISLGEEARRGRGIGREAVIVFLRWAWQNRPVRQIYLHALDWNERALRCFSGAGFELVARVLRDDQVFMRMEARREWWLLWDMEGRFPLMTPNGQPQEVATSEGPFVPFAAEVH
jgi:RimJ/RimL family protein N-acetyltransferase